MSSEATPDPEFETKNRLENKWLLAIIVASFIFALISIPAYRIFCKVVDPGGSAAQNGTTQEYIGKVDESRTIRVRFTTNVNRELPWNFLAKTSHLDVHPGQKNSAMFYAKNLHKTAEMTGKGVYDINPPEAGQYFKKIECFCFREQTLAAGDEMDLPLVFWFDEKIPDHITEVTIAYTFFNMETSLKRSLKRAEEQNQL